MIADIETSLKSVDQMRGMYKSQLDTLTKEIELLGHTVSTHEDAVRLCEVCLAKQTDLKVHIEHALTSFLQALFDDTYAFKFDEVYKDKDKKVLNGLKIMVYKNGIPGEAVPGGDHGGGVLNAVNFGLQFVIARLLPGFTPFMCVDEGFANMNRQRFPAVVQFIEECNKISPIQTINVTHTDAEFPQTLNVSMPGTISVVESVTGESI